MQPNSPLYQRFSGMPSREVLENHFALLARHPALPLAVQRELFERGETTGWHRHADFLALYAVRRGKGVHWIDEAPYALARGDIYLMAPGATHRYCDFEGLEVDALYFQIELFQDDELEALRQSAGLWRLFAGGANLEHRIHLTAEEWNQSDAGIESLRDEWSDRSLPGEILLRQGLFRELIYLARLLDQREHARGRGRGNIEGDSAPAADSLRVKGASRISTAISEALRYCEENAEKELTVPQIAARFFFSPAHFSEVFRREVGMPPAAYIRRVRLEKARTLLRTTDLPITGVAEQSGFGDPAHFSRIFRSHYGYSPLKYRKRTP